MPQKKPAQKKIPAKTRKRNFRDVIKAFPELEKDKDVESVADELDAAQEISSFATSPAGIEMIDTQTASARSILKYLLENYSKMSLELIQAQLARLEARTKFILELQGAPENEENLQSLLDEMIKERKQ